MTTFLDQSTGGFCTKLKATASITALIGSGASARIYEDVAKQGVAAPYIVYLQGDGGESYRHHGGITSLRETVVHVYCYGDTTANANALAEAVKLAGELGGQSSWGSTAVHTVTASIPDGGTESPIDGSDTNKPWRRVVLRILHTQATS